MGIVGRKHSEETKQKIALSKIGKSFPKLSEAKKGIARPDMMGNTYGFRKGKPSWNAGKVGVYSDEYRMKLRLAKLGKKHSREFVQKRVSATLRAVCQRPNKFEVRALAYLEHLYPKRFSYTGDGSCMVNGYSADAVDLKTRTVALFNGVYWHLMRHGYEISDASKGALELIEAQPFLQAGYRVIFIWEDELNSVVIA